MVGFAAETENLLANARGRLQDKRLDFTVANAPRQAMGAEDNKVSLMTADGLVE